MTEIKFDVGGSKAELALAEIVGGILWLENYPGYRPRWVPIKDMPDLERVLCDGCNFVVSEDEYLECPQCGNHMCLYCYQSGVEWSGPAINGPPNKMSGAERVA